MHLALFSQSTSLTDSKGSGIVSTRHRSASTQRFIPMLVPVFYVLNGLLALSGLLALWLRSGEQRFSLSLIQVIAGLPLLAGEYLYLAYHLEARAARVVLFSEVVFALTWLAMAMRLRSATLSGERKSRISILGEIGVGAVVTAGAAFFLGYRLVPEISASILTFSNAGPAYFSSVLLLITVFYAAWRLEQFWRSLDTRLRWEYKTVVVGSFLVCGTLIWSSSYRLTYLAVLPKHVLLLSALLPLGWGLIFYGVLRHRLLNRKIFVSRKVVYSEDFSRGLQKKLSSMEIIIDCKDEIRINTDPKLLFSILENLLLNGFEAQGEGALVQIRAGRDDDTGQALIEVMDNGPGIAEDLLPDLLFEPFKTTKDGGSGIGLWQVKRLVTALGGTISASNRAKGGARFVVQLPLRPAKPRQ